MIKLIIFDLDGTLVKPRTLALLPGVRGFFHLAIQNACASPGMPSLAIATNQGGVGFRCQLEAERHTFAAWFYPSESSGAARIRRVVSALGGDGQTLPVYASYAYRDQQGRWSPTPDGKDDDPRWRRDWRKPQPGMLLQAMRDCGANPTETLYVGDRDEDRGAARAAGCRFASANEFFSRAWDGYEAIRALREADF